MFCGLHFLYQLNSLSTKEEEAAKAKQIAKPVEDDGILELTEDGSFDTAAVDATKPKPYAAAAAAAANIPAPKAEPRVVKPSEIVSETQPEEESTAMQIDGANVSFPETEEERERKIKEEEEDKTPPRKSRINFGSEPANY